MFAHIFKYRLKCLLRNKTTIFWTLMFPLVLATLFNLAFSNLDSAESFTPIDIAVVNSPQYLDNTDFKSVLEGVSKGDGRLFNLTETSQSNADQLLKDNTISGYIIADSPIKLVVSSSGINQNITKIFIDNYMQSSHAAATIIMKYPYNTQAIIADIGNRKDYVKEVSASSASPKEALNYFYVLIAMACFYGAFFGASEVTDIQANISPIAARVNLTPVHKLKAFVYSSSASLLVHVIEMFIFLAYLYFVLKIDFGSNTGFVLLTTFVGSLCGLSFGAFISALVKKSESIKLGIIIGVTMFFSFLAGMMYQGMKYIIAQHAPILSYLNPLNLLTDAFYSLYYYDTYTRYELNMFLLLAFIVIFSSVTYILLRRRKYASI